ncbi:MAG: protein kinase [Lachnospiraceae bacterium]|nr:protein kinase [Lachnospiraceae bacterium]
MLQPGQIIKDVYKVMSPITSGGEGEIFLARHLRLQKNVVIKRLKDEIVGNFNDRKEADILKKLRHRYLPQVYDFIQMGTEVYTIIDYIDGKPLSKYIREGYHFDEARIILWTRQLLEALVYLHQQNPPIIHYDIKPQNIMVDRNGDVCLIDFGISFGQNVDKIDLACSKDYGSPEQIARFNMFSQGGPYQTIAIDVRTDIYSLGASIRRCMASASPNSDLSYLSPEERINTYSESFRDIINKATEYYPQNRYNSAAEMLFALNNMKKKDRQYQSIRRAQIIVTSLLAILFALGLVLAFRGMQIRTEESYRRDYQNSIQCLEDGFSEEALNTAFSVLNNESYSDILEKNPQQKAELLYITGEAYFDNYDYENALEFYRQATTVDTSNPKYFRDYAITLARLNKLDEAESIAESAKAAGLESDSLSTVQAEIALAKKDYDGAIRNFLDIINNTTDNDLRSRATLLCARAYMQTKQYEKGIELLQNSYAKTTGTWQIRILREIGTNCISYQLENENTDTYLALGIRCYETLEEKGKITILDAMNLSVLYELNGETEKCISLLTQLQDKYPEDYRIPMRLCIAEFSAQDKLEQSLRDYRKAKTYYDEAEKLYQKVRNKGNTDENMLWIEELIRQAEANNWLN